jgi:hypothetical protein
LHVLNLLYSIDNQRMSLARWLIDTGAVSWNEPQRNLKLYELINEKFSKHLLTRCVYSEVLSRLFFGR